jgi:hypothetical protein
MLCFLCCLQDSFNTLNFFALLHPDFILPSPECYHDESAAMATTTNGIEHTTFTIGLASTLLFTIMLARLLHAQSQSRNAHASASTTRPNAALDIDMVTTETTIREPSKLLSLPTELREIIYELSMRVGGHLSSSLCAPVPTTSHPRTLAQCLPAVCFLTQREAHLARTVFFRNADFLLYRDGDAAVLARWLAKHDAWSYVRYMHLACTPQHRRRGFREDLVVLKRCTQVRGVRVSIPVPALGVYFGTWDVREERVKTTLIRLLSRRDISKTLQLEGLAECEALWSVRLILWNKDVEWYERKFRAMALVENVERIKRCFERKYGREIAIGIEWACDEGMRCGCVKLSA